jgi:hypothetical protein
MRAAHVLALAIAAISAGGCTTTSLSHYTINQIETASDVRTRETLNCLAAVAANADTLPSFALLSDGAVHVQDQDTFSPTTTWSRLINSFATQSLEFTASRSPYGQWTVAPVVDQAPLEAMRCSCQWVLYGPEVACRNCPGLLDSAENDHTQSPHFGVADRLRRLPPAWLHVGKLKDIPACALYTGHCGDTWTWVTADGTEGLNDFMLVLLSIATLHTASYSSPLLVNLTKEVVTPLPDPTDSSKHVATVTILNRAVKQEYIEIVNNEIKKALSSRGGVVDLTWAQWMAYTEPWLGAREIVSPTGSVASKQSITQLTATRSAISAPTGPGAERLAPGGYFVAPSPQFQLRQQVPQQQIPSQQVPQFNIERAPIQ